MGDVLVRLHTCDLYEVDGRQGTANMPTTVSLAANTDYLTIY